MEEFFPETWIKEYKRYQIRQSRLNKLVFKGTKEEAKWIEECMKLVRKLVRINK